MEAAVVTLVPVPAKVEAPVGVVVNEMEVVTGELAVLINFGLDYRIVEK